jgi:uncharacterized protein involved in exopolysaccharide biosynthesis
MSERPVTSASHGLKGPNRGRLFYLLPAALHPRDAADEVDLPQLAEQLWRGRLIILCTALISAAAAAAYAFSARSWYRADVVLAVNDRDPSAAVGGPLAQLGGLAGLAGISLGGRDKVTPVAILRSRGFARRFIEDKDLLTTLFPDRWDRQGKRWTVSGAKIPDIRDAVRVFERDVRRVSVDKETGLVTLSVDWIEPKVAAQWANELVERVNQETRAMALANAERNVAFLRAELSTNGVASMQQSVGRLLESELQKLMLARGESEFAFRVIDAAETPKKRVRPMRSLLVIAAAALGALLGAGLVLLRNALRTTR